MSKPVSPVVTISCLNGFLAVAGGAFGAHAISDPAAKALLSTAAHYQLGAAAAGLALALLPQDRLLAGRLLGGRPPALLVAVGGLVFGASLDLLAFSGQRWLGAITPIGGVLMLAGFGLGAFSSLRGAE